VYEISQGGGVKLAELDPEFLKRINDGSWEILESLEGAEGVSFLCPVCFTANGGPVGTHRIEDFS